MFDKASELYNDYLKIYFDEYKTLSEAETELDNKRYYDIWFENEESAEKKKKW